MIKHIVFWKFHDTAAGRTKEENLELAKHMMEGMVGKVPGIVKLEVGLHKDPAEHNGDLALYSEFNSWKDLDVYRVHPEHEKVKDFLADVRYEVRAVDYEV
jgi:hypothetical protein